MTTVGIVSDVLGGGKTFTGMLLALRAKAKGRPVYLNYHVKGINTPEIYPGEPEKYEENHFYINSLERLNKPFLPNAFVEIDEFYEYLDARASAKEANRTRTHILFQSRKKGFEFVHLEPAVRAIDWRGTFVTELYLYITPTHYYVSKLDGRKHNCGFKIDEYKHIFSRILPTGRQSKYISPQIFFKYRNFYDTNESVIDIEPNYLKS